MTLEKLLEHVGVRKGDFEDLHITRFLSAFVAVSNGKVIKVTDPCMKYCPLAGMLYESVRRLKNSGPELLKDVIAKVVEEKISKFGSFTKRRELYREDIAVPYGASEMMMYAMRKKIIDAAVIVCDGAGTVIVDRPGVLQGIGARMNGLFYTSPIPEITGELERNGCRVVFPDAAIEQIKGLEKAAQLGYKNIAVTISGYMDENLAGVEKIEKKYGVSAASFIVCTTGVTVERVREITRHSDLVWSCASREVREMTGQSARSQLSVAIPVFVMTEKGRRLAAGYSPDEEFLKKLDLGRQYLVSSSPGGRPPLRSSGDQRSPRSGAPSGRQIGMGNFPAYLTEQKLPVAGRGGWPGPS